MQARRGSIFDLSVILIVLLTATISFFFAALIYTEWDSQFGAFTVSQGMNTTEIYSIRESGTNTIGLAIELIPFLVFGVGFAAIVMALMIPASPIFLPISVGLLVVFTILSTIFSNFLQAFLSTNEMVPIANAHPLIASVAYYLPWIITVFGGILIIVMHSRSGDSGLEK